MTTAAKYPAALLALADVGGEIPGFPEVTLSGAHNSAVTTITLTATVPAYWPTAGWVTIDSEIIAYGGKSGATLTSCTRGAQSAYSSSTAAPHADAAKVGYYLSPQAINQIIADLIATQTALGINLANVLTSTLTVLLKGAKSTDIASATTTDLSTATGNYAHITGTTTITAFGTVTAGTLMTLKFDGALKVTYNATTVILAGATDFYTQAGDTLTLESEGSGNWREVSRQYGTTAAKYVQGTALAGDVTMTTGGTEYDGPTISLTAGVWDVSGRVTQKNTSGAAHQGRAQLWDGSTVYASAGNGGPANMAFSYSLREIISLTTTTTIKISCKDDTNGALIKAADPNYSAGNNEGRISAVRVF